MDKIKEYVVGKDNFDIAGKIGLKIGDVYGLEIDGKGQAWIPVLWQGEEDPDWVKANGVVVVRSEKLPEYLMKIKHSTLRIIKRENILKDKPCYDI